MANEHRRFTRPNDRGEFRRRNRYSGHSIWCNVYDTVSYVTGDCLACTANGREKSESEPLSFHGSSRQRKSAELCGRVLRWPRTCVGANACSSSTLSANQEAKFNLVRSVTTQDRSRRLSSRKRKIPAVSCRGLYTTLERTQKELEFQCHRTARMTCLKEASASAVLLHGPHPKLLARKVRLTTNMW